MNNLRDDILEMFDGLSGCFDPEDSHELRRDIRVIQGVHDPHPEADKWLDSKSPKVKKSRNMELKQAYEKRRLQNPIKRAKKNKSQRKRRVVRRIDEWMADAKIVCVGRDLNPLRWYEILTSEAITSNDPNIYAAFEDFVYFLNHKKVHIKQIASMLEAPEVYIKGALLTRGITG